MSFILAFIPVVIALILAVPVFSDALNSAKWPVSHAVVVKNDHKVGRTAAFQVGEKKYSTTFENALELTASRYGYEFNLGHEVNIYNGIDPEMGKNIRVSYNPANPSEAVVEPGFTIPVCIYLICACLTLFIGKLFPASYRN
ncbi:DUF3592 domain-containing protein [bacterium]|nr:DUF3592 domain-containing protein [bacterium]MBP9809526.1 DUF3592 domain-containing protein [bacterium]